MGNARLAVFAAAAILASSFPGAAAARFAQQGDDPLSPQQWGLERIDAASAWAVSTGAGATIAIVDTGVDVTHPDLTPQLILRPDADFVSTQPPCTARRRSNCDPDGPHDRHGHGTHVAGIAGAATANGIGVAGVAPDARILPVRVLGANGGGSTRDVGAGIRYAVDHGADVVNLSLTFASGEGEVDRLLGRLEPIYSAIDYAWSQGAVIIVAAGNDSFPLCAEPSAHDRALCVGATDRRDLRSFFSNSDTVGGQDFLVAPGGDGLTCDGDILSTVLWDGPRPQCSQDAGYDTDAGTSMAAPYVSGVAALLVARGFDNATIVRCLLATAEDVGAPGRDSIYGSGLVDAAAAVGRCA